MPGGGPKKSRQEIMLREIVMSLIAFTIIGGVVLTACICRLVSDHSGAMTMLPVVVILFVVIVLGFGYVRGVRELRRRRQL